MKVLVFVHLCVCAVVLAENYLETIVHHYHYQSLGPDVTKAHLDCFLDEGPCDEISTSFKKVIPEAVTTRCARCSDTQKNTAWLFLTSVVDNIPSSMDKFKAKYDPENKYFDAFVESIAPKE